MLIPFCLFNCQEEIIPEEKYIIENESYFRIQLLIYNYRGLMYINGQNNLKFSGHEMEISGIDRYGNKLTPYQAFGYPDSIIILFDDYKMAKMYNPHLNPGKPNTVGIDKNLLDEKFYEKVDPQNYKFTFYKRDFEHAIEIED